MIGFLAAAGVVIWLLGIAAFAVFLPKWIREIPQLSIAADLAPALIAAYFAVICVAWPALYICVVLDKTFGRSKP